MIIDLDGPLGNAYYLFAVVRKLCRVNPDTANEIIKDMKSGDYHNLIRVFINNFPSVELVTNNPELQEVINDSLAT